MDANSSGAVAARLATDAILVKAAAGDRVSVIVQNVSLVVIAFTIAIVIQWKMALVIIAIFPFIIVSAIGEVGGGRGGGGWGKGGGEGEGGRGGLEV